MMTDSHAPRRSRGRPRRSDRQRQDMRAQIEDAASNLFQSDGYSAVSMRRIAKAVGCSPMAIYAYFDNKVDLLRSLWVHVFDDLFQQIEHAITTAPTPEDKLRALSSGYVGYWIAHPERYRMVFMAEGISQSDVSLFVDNPNISKHVGRIFDLVGQLGDAGQSETDAKTKSDLLLAALHGIAHTQITISGYDWVDYRVLVDGAVKAIAP